MTGKTFLGMKIIENRFLSAGTVLLVSDSFWRDLYPLPSAEDILGSMQPYDPELVPRGEEPVLMLSEHFEWIDWKSRREMNNWLIELFGTRPKPFKFAAGIGLQLGIPRRLLGGCSP